jgi:hypothetical protein
MPLDAPVTIATLSSSLLILAIVLDPRFETACQQVIPRNASEGRAFAAVRQFCQNIRHCASWAAASDTYILAQRKGVPLDYGKR